MPDPPPASDCPVQRRLFHDRMATYLDGKTAERSQFITEDQYDTIVYVLTTWDEWDSKERKMEHPQCYRWKKKYSIISVGDDNVLVENTGAAAANSMDNDEADDNEAGALDASVVVSHQGRVYDDLLAAHLAGGHCKNRQLQHRVKAKHGGSIPGWASLLFVACCAICTRAKQRKKTVAGFKPIITPGFGSRGQVDLIDMQSCPDGQFKFLMNYQVCAVAYSIPTAPFFSPCVIISGVREHVKVCACMYMFVCMCGCMCVCVCVCVCV